VDRWGPENLTVRRKEQPCGRGEHPVNLLTGLTLREAEISEGSPCPFVIPCSSYLLEE